MNRATLQLILEARDMATPALSRLREETRRTGQDSLDAARSMATLGRAAGDIAPASEAMERMRRAFQGLGSSSDPAGFGLERMRSVFGELAGKGAPGMLEAITRQASALPQAVAGAARAYSRLQSHVREAPQHFAAGGTVFPRLASPLIARGSGSMDDVPAMLMRGEFVLRKDAVHKYGLSFLQALNEMRLPSLPVTLAPRFASGGAVLPPHLAEMAPRFAKGGIVSTGFAAADSLLERYLSMNSSQIATQHNALVQGLVQRLKLPHLRETPSQYLSEAIGSATKGLRVFEDTATPPLEKADTLQQVSAELARNKNLLNKEYLQRINAAKREGNDELAAMLEMQRLELEALVEELMLTLESLAQDYVAEVQNAAIEAASKIENMRSEIEELESRAASARLVRGHVGGSYNARGAEGALSHMQRQSIVDTMSGARGPSWYGSTGVRNDYTIQIEKMKTLIELEEKRAGSLIRSMGRSLKRESSLATREIQREGVLFEAGSRQEMRRYYNDTLRRVQELEIEWKQSLNDLDNEYGKADISGFKHWLAMGGPVGFARGGSVPETPGSTPGRDSVPALLMPGEFVLRKEAVQALGLGSLERLNGLDASIARALAPAMGEAFQNARHFASGGLVAGQSLSGSLAAQPGSADFGSLTLNVGGASHTLWADRQVARSLRKGLTRLAKGVS